MPSEVAKRALDKGLITQKQYSNLNPGLLDAISKKKLGMAKGKSNPKVKPGGKVRQGKRRKKGKK
tara:strand:- start:693 stop:887 length:195 start_codon:yes stop_codon:yes gene_type:complete